MKKLIRFLLPAVLVFGIVCLITALTSAPACSATARTAIGRPVDDGQAATPMGGVIFGCQCFGQDVYCRGANGQLFHVVHCPGSCLNAMCQ